MLKPNGMLGLCRGNGCDTDLPNHHVGFESRKDLTVSHEAKHREPQEFDDGSRSDRATLLMSQKQL
jgi:hypothetical protein